MEEQLRLLEEKVINIIDAHSKLRETLKKTEFQLSEMKEQNEKYETENQKIKARIEQLLDSIEEAESIVDEFSQETTTQSESLYEII